MPAIFKVHQTFVLNSRSLFVIAGEIIQGAIRPGMNIHISANDGLGMDIPVQGIEFLRKDGGELVALTVALEDQSDADFLQQFDVVGETLVVSDGA